MRGVTLKAPINEFSGSFFVTNSTDGELHDFWITEHCGEHRNVLMGQLPCNQPLCFKQWHSSLPVHNAEVTGAGAQRREPKAVSFWRPVDRLVSGRSPPWLSLTPKAACPLPDSLHQLNGCRNEPQRNSRQHDYRSRRTAPQLGHAMKTITADHCGNQGIQRTFRPWRSSEYADCA